MSSELKVKNPSAEICIFKLLGKCKREETCKFDHAIQPQMRDKTWIDNKVLDMSKKIDKCVLEMVSQGSCPKKNECMFPHVIRTDESKQKHAKKSKVCFFEMEAPGNCRRGEQCHFRHNITDEERNDGQFRKQVDEERMAKKSICINEYMQTNSCLKKDSCTFRHSITDRERNCSTTQENMELKWCKITGKNARSTHTNAAKPTRKHLLEGDDLTMQEMRTFMMELKNWMTGRRP